MFGNSKLFLFLTLMCLNISLGLAQDITFPTVTLTSNDSDNVISSASTVTIIATFSEAVASPTIWITGLVTSTNDSMTQSVTAATMTQSTTTSFFLKEQDYLT